MVIAKPEEEIRSCPGQSAGPIPGDGSPGSRLGLGLRAFDFIVMRRIGDGLDTCLVELDGLKMAALVTNTTDPEPRGESSELWNVQRATDLAGQHVRDFWVAGDSLDVPCPGVTPELMFLALPF